MGCATIDWRPLSNLNKRCTLHHPDTMALSSGIYTIQNVKYRNWAMLLNANQGEVVAGSSATTDVGEKVGVSKTWNHRRRLTKSCSGSSTNWQTGRIRCRINSTTPIMRATLILISRRTRQQFRAFGTSNWRPCNGASIPPILKGVICTSFCESLRDEYLSRSLSGYQIWAATVIGAYRASFSKPRYCCSPWCSSKWRLKRRSTPGWTR